MNTATKKYSLDEICSLSSQTKRTVRYYIQQGLVDRPIGEKRGAHYTEHHLEQLLEVQKWKNAGLSLERIRELLVNEKSTTPPPPPRKPGSIEVWSRIQINDGIELNINPERAGLTPEQVRALSKQIMLFSNEMSNQGEGNE